MSCMLTDQYRFYVFCQRDSSEAGPVRVKGCRGGKRWPPGTLAKGLTRDNEPKKLECLKGLRGETVVGLLRVSALSFHNDPGPGAREALGSRAAPPESGCCSFSPDGFLP